MQPKCNLERREGMRSEKEGSAHRQARRSNANPAISRTNDTIIAGGSDSGILHAVKTIAAVAAGTFVLYAFRWLVCAF
jgi:Xaa-Pro aminopeptidase